VMLHRMLVGDFLRFALIFVIWLVGLTTAMFVVFSENRNENESTKFKNFRNSLITVFKFSIGAEDIDIISISSGYCFAVFLYVLLGVVSTVLLINMLIAAMSDTYASMSGVRNTIWRKLRMATVLLLERRSISCSMRRRMRNCLLYNEDRGIWVLPIKELNHLRNTVSHDIYQQRDDYSDSIIDVAPAVSVF
jgi:transient receptor potential cation channel subfamily V protein 5